jgi:hypothetical protein
MIVVLCDLHNVLVLLDQVAIWNSKDVERSIRLCKYLTCDCFPSSDYIKLLVENAWAGALHLEVSIVLVFNALLD